MVLYYDFYLLSQLLYVMNTCLFSFYALLLKPAQYARDDAMLVIQFLCYPYQVSGLCAFILAKYD